MKASASAAPAAGLNESFTVRKISYGEGVERVFPVMSPMINSIKVVRRGKVRRAKLYYLRNLRGKSARIVEKKTDRAAPPSASNSRARSEFDEKRGLRPRFFVAHTVRHRHSGAMRSIDPESRDSGSGAAHHPGMTLQCISRFDTSCAIRLRCSEIAKPSRRRVVLDDRSRLPWRFFGRFTTSALAA